MLTYTPLDPRLRYYMMKHSNLILDGMPSGTREKIMTLFTVGVIETVKHISKIILSSAAVLPLSRPSTALVLCLSSVPHPHTHCHTYPHPRTLLIPPRPDCHFRLMHSHLLLDHACGYHGNGLRRRQFPLCHQAEDSEYNGHF